MILKYHKGHAIKKLKYNKKLDIYTTHPLPDYLIDEIHIRRSILITKQHAAEKVFSSTILDPICRLYNIQYSIQTPFYIYDKYFFLDFYLPQHRVGIEIDGPMHQLPDNVKYDKLREKYFKKYVYVNLIRYTNHTVYTYKFLLVYNLLHQICNKSKVHGSWKLWLKNELKHLNDFERKNKIFNSKLNYILNK